MKEALELKYHLELFKIELQKKENSDYQRVLMPVEEILKHLDKKPVSSDKQKILNYLETIQKEHPENYFALTLLAYCYLYGFYRGSDDCAQFLLKSSLILNKDFVFANFLLGYYLGSYYHPSGYAYTNIIGMLRRIDVDKGLEYLNHAAKFQYLPAIYELTQILHGEKCVWFEEYEIICPKKLEEGVKTAAIGYPKAAFHMHNIASQKSDFKNSTMYLEFCAKAGNQEAQYELGQCYEKAIGVEANLDTAIHWYNICTENSFDMGYHFEIGALFTLAKIYETRGLGQDLSLAEECCDKIKLLGTPLQKKNQLEFPNARAWQKIYVCKKKLIALDDILNYCTITLQKLSQSEALKTFKKLAQDECRDFLTQYRTPIGSCIPKGLIHLVSGYLMESAVESMDVDEQSRKRKFDAAASDDSNGIDVAARPPKSARYS